MPVVANGADDARAVDEIREAREAVQLLFDGRPLSRARVGQLQLEEERRRVFDVNLIRAMLV